MSKIDEIFFLPVCLSLIDSGVNTFFRRVCQKLPKKISAGSGLSKIDKIHLFQASGIKSLLLSDWQL